MPFTMIRNREGMGRVSKKNKSEAKAKYSPVLASVEKVIVRVPKENEYSIYVLSHIYRNNKGARVKVDPHLESRCVINGEKVQRNIFGWQKKFAGRKMVADVEVRRKTTSASREQVCLIDIRLRPEISLREADWELKFSPEGERIPGMNISLLFDAL